VLGHCYVEFDMSDDEQVGVASIEHQAWAIVSLIPGD
jgi:hypothetical protein